MGNPGFGIHGLSWLFGFNPMVYHRFTMVYTCLYMFILWFIQFYYLTFALYNWPLRVYPIFRQPCGHGVMLMVEMCPNWPWSIYSMMWLGVLFRWGQEITEWSYTMEADLRASKSSKTGWITSGLLDYCRGNLPCVFLAWTRPTAASGVRLFGPEPGWNESDLNHKPSWIMWDGATMGHNSPE